MPPPSSNSSRADGLTVYETVKLALAWIVGSVVLTQLVFYLFPLAHHMAANADSLVLFDFAHDVLQGHTVRYWNLPRAPYLFPDAILALVLMSFDWWGEITLTAVAVMNLLVLCTASCLMMRLARSNQKLSRFSCSFFLGLALLTLAICFPFTMVNIYWQMFASGAHFLGASIVLLILYLDLQWQKHLLTKRTFLLIFLLCFAEAISDSLSTVLLMLWMGAEILWRIGSYVLQKRQTIFIKNEPAALFIFIKQQADLALIFTGLLLGTLVTLWIPRQSLLESFLSLDKLTIAALSFFQWVLAEPTHVLYIITLIILILLYPALMRESYSEGRVVWKNYWRSSVLTPALGVMCIAPFFYQDVGSIRYFAFPGLISIISLALVSQRVWQFLSAQDSWRQRALTVAAYLIFLGLIGTWQYRHRQIGPNALDTLGIDQVGLSVGADATGASQCIDKARLQWPLVDGVSTYWNARPIRFATNFNYYLAQIDPWRPRNGAFLWGNNGIDLVYSNVQKQIPRHYNFIVTTPAEMNAHLWSNLPAKATGVLTCANHQVFYFEIASVLWDYLYPLQVPYGEVDFTHSLHPIKSSLLVRTYWGDDLFTQAGVRQGSRILANGDEGVLVFGPYIPLAPGRYRLSAQGGLENPMLAPKAVIGTLEVNSTLGKLHIASAPIVNSQKLNTQRIDHQIFASLDFKVSKTIDNVEFRIQVARQTRGIFVRYQLEALPSVDTK